MINNSSGRNSGLSLELLYDHNDAAVRLGSPFVVLVHGVHQFPDFVNGGILVGNGTAVDIAFGLAGYFNDNQSMLRKEQRDCHTNGEINYVNSYEKERYSQAECRLKEAAKQAEEKC